MVNIFVVPQASFGPKKYILMTSCNVESVTKFRPENIIFEDYGVNDACVNFVLT